MSQNIANAIQFETSNHSSGGLSSLIIGADEFLRINISNRLNNLFQQTILTKENLHEAMDYLSHTRVDLVVIDIDQLDESAIDRFYKLLSHLETPCLMTGSDTNFLNKLRLELDTNFISFLPKTILNTMFGETIKVLLDKNALTQKLTKRIIKTSALPKSKYLYLLAVFLFLEPFIKIFYLKFTTSFEWDVLLRTIFSIDGVIKNFEFWAIFPLAGYALISVRSWSFFFFIGLQLYSLYAFATYEKFTWPYVAEAPHISTSFLLFTNILIMAYFLVPAHFRPYWYESRKIWRNTSRFGTSLKAFFHHQNETVNTTITNISETGAYFTSTKSLPIGHRMYIDLPINGQMRSLEAIVRRAQHTAHENYFGYGIEFNFKSNQEKQNIKEYIETLNSRIQ